MVGMVKTGLDHETNHCTTNNAWYLFAYNGGLWGDGQCNQHEQGGLKIGDRVLVLVDLDGGHSRGRRWRLSSFFVNGSEYGSGFKSGVVGPVVLGVELYDRGQVVTLLPNSQKPSRL